MAVRSALVVCPVLVAVLLATQWAEPTHAARTGGAFVDYFANGTAVAPLITPGNGAPGQLYAKKSFYLEVAGVNETDPLRCLSNDYGTGTITGYCKETHSTEIILTDCNAGAEEYALYTYIGVCYLKQVVGPYKGYFISRGSTYLSVRKEPGNSEWFNCNYDAIVWGQPFTLTWSGDYPDRWSILKDVMVTSNCDKYQRIKKFKDRGAIELIATHIRDYDE